MIDAIRQLFGRPSPGAKPFRPLPAVPPAERVYAVGDIHGRLDLFGALVEAIERDDAARGGGRTTIVLLGDLIDRGPDSAGVVAAARALQERRKVRIICGNHEEQFLASFGEPDALAGFLRFGGRDTIRSYSGLSGDPAGDDLAELLRLMRRTVPETDLAFLRTFEDRVEIGDYVFVHAGIRPGLPLARQQLRDLRWIREPFLSHGGDHGFVVVHGHTITPEPEVRGNRIGIDTGAYASGRLTALGLEGTERWLIEACESGGKITTFTRPIQAGSNR